MNRDYYWYDQKESRRLERICTVSYDRYNIGVAHVRWHVYPLPVLISCIREPLMVAIINDLGRVYDGAGFTDVIRWSDFPSEKSLTHHANAVIVDTDGENVNHLRLVKGRQTDNGYARHDQIDATPDGATPDGYTDS